MERGGGGDGVGDGVGDTRRRSSTATTTTNNFLRTVKQVQIARRLEKLAKMKSESHVSLLQSDANLRSELTHSEPPPPPQDNEKKERFPSLASIGDVGEKPSPWQYLGQVIVGKGLVSACLLAAPLALLANALDWSDTAKFWLNFVTMIPLASILGDFTEEVALHTNEVRT